MTLTRRSLLTLAGGLASTAGLAACAAEPGRTPTPSPSPGTPSGPLPKLSVWYHAYPDEGVERAVRRWAASYPWARVTVSWGPEDYAGALRAALPTPAGPDVFEWATGPTLEMIAAGQVADVTEAVGAKRAEFGERILRRLTHRGRLWGVPQALDTQLLYYRRSLLTDAGLQPPKTLAELIRVAEAVRTPDMGGFYAGPDGGLAALGPLLPWAAGLDQVSADGTTPAFAGPALYEAVDAFRELLRSPGLRRSASTGWADATPFINNETALQWGGVWDLDRVQAAHAGDFGVLPFPAVGAAGRQVVPVSASCACVNARSGSLAAAQDYVRTLWVDDDAKQLEFATAYGMHIPAKPKLFALAARVASGVGAEAARYAHELGYADDLRWTPACRDAYAAGLRAVVEDGRDPRTAFATAADAVTAELRRLAG